MKSLTSGLKTLYLYLCPILLIVSLGFNVILSDKSIPRERIWEIAGKEGVTTTDVENNRFSIWCEGDVAITSLTFAATAKATMVSLSFGSNPLSVVDITEQVNGKLKLAVNYVDNKFFPSAVELNESVDIRVYTDDPLQNRKFNFSLFGASPLIKDLPCLKLK